MDYETFTKIVGGEKISQFKILNEHIPDVGSDDFVSLFKIWKHFNKQPENKTEDEINNKNLISTINMDQKEINKENLINITDQNAIQYASPKLPRTNSIKILADVLVHAPIEKEPEMIKMTENNTENSSAKTSEINKTEDTSINHNENSSINTTVDISTNETEKNLTKGLQTSTRFVQLIHHYLGNT